MFTGTLEAIQEALPNTALTADEFLAIRSLMAEKGYEVSCGLCYVEGSRAKMGEYTRQFLEAYAKTDPTYLPNMAEMNTATGQERIRREHPDVYAAYEKFMNGLGQRKPKLYMMDTAYDGEVLQKFGTKRGIKTVKRKNENGGLRLQSFSDFEIIHLIDTMQVITDMSRVGLAGQAYTKVPDFAKALGGTGLKINLSLITKGLDSNGRLVLDGVEGMTEENAMSLRDQYSDNVGTVLVVFNHEQLKAAMADDRIDYILPFHRSQWNSGQYEALGLPAGAKDFTPWQNESYIEPVFNEDGKKLRPSNYMPNAYWDFSKTGKENAEAYLQMCAANNRKPKFSDLLVNNGDGSYSLQPDGSTDGYWKLLIDFKMYNNDGVGVPQQPVRPDFNMEEAQRMLRDYTGGHARFPVAQGIVDEFVKKYKADNPGKRYSVDSSETGNKRNYDYENLVSKPDIVVAAIPMREIPTKGKRVDMPKITGAAREKANLLSGGDFGDQRYVIVKDLNEKVLVNSRGLPHGLTGNKTNSGTMSTAEVTYELPAILENSIAVNEREPRTADDGKFGYVLFGYAEREDGQGYIVKSTVNHFADNKSVVDDVEIYNVLKGSKAKKVGSEEPTKGETAHGAATLETQRPVSPQSQSRTISVADMLDIVKDNYPELLPDSVREHFGITDASKESGLRYSVDSSETAEQHIEYLKKNGPNKAMAAVDDELLQGYAEGSKRHSIESDTKEVYTESRKTEADKYWRPDLTKAQLKRLQEWVKYNAQVSEDSVTDKANWTFRKFDGMQVFAIYSTEDPADPTILYESKNEQAEFERDFLREHLEVFENGESNVRESEAVDEVLSGSWVREGSSADNGDRTAAPERNLGDAGFLFQASGRHTSRAFESVLRNLFQVPEVKNADTEAEHRYSVDSDQDINPDTGYRRGSAMDSAMRIYNAKHKSTYRQFLTDDPSYQGGGAADKYEALKQVKSAVKARANEIMSDWLWKQDIEPIFKS